MMYRPLIVLGISTIFTGFALPCRAQSAPAEGSSVTLSGESLTTIESRTSSEDYQDFFSGTTPIEGNRFATPNSRRISSSASEDFASFLEEEYGVVIGDTIRYPEYMQYILPTAAIPDLVMALLRHHLPILGPLTILLVSLALLSLVVGSYRIQRAEGDRLSVSGLWEILSDSLRGILYLQHWLAIMPATTARMSVRPKRLKWVKTAHQGATEEQFGIG